MASWVQEGSQWESCECARESLWGSQWEVSVGISMVLP